MKPDENLKVALYQNLVKSRELEEQLTELPGFHAGVGEEAVVVGSFFGLAEDEYCAPHYRGALMAAHMRGADLHRLIAGVLGKATSYNRGRVRGDICLPFQFRTLGMFSGVLGNPMNIATGMALAAKQRRDGKAVVTSFGEGTSNIGGFHEALNMAACLSLPIVYVCQNNGYAMSTRTEYAIKAASVADRAGGYGVPGVQVDGNDVLAVFEAVQSALQRARAGQGPTLIDARTYRLSGHYTGDTNFYQPAEEREQWIARDPVQRLRADLAAQGILDEVRLNEIRAAAHAEVAAAIAAAQADPEADLSALGTSDLYSPSQVEEAAA
ncbi:pyruvate dehydrogenase E1 component alpha subunit [Pseudaminobacter salicylatoxidans]|uniref:2-oxoisovalerate dehydrogenase subunit alpha n=1 Tax=Pseudaminobacter salicylatoxidans TaxID=93369 RepID=A0A316C4U8_PSESE|nr:thiamine pyrophosphate-dependent dehydrogenase E1 component subunit alpha [Pseudaminobacter salicylatoxidans]PWJ84578.1 pyruvate dehydrogenase E1 component alpha subunit [Pseudaminobacter salicylatoxidans]